MVSIPVSQRRSIGPHYLNLTPDDEDEVILTAVSSGKKVNLVIASLVSTGSRIRSDISSGIPAIDSSRVRIKRNIRVRSNISSGIPDVNARIRKAIPTPQGESRIRSDINSGIPDVDARVRTTRNVRIRSDISSGVPSVDARVRLFVHARIRSNIQSGSVNLGLPYSLYISKRS